MNIALIVLVIFLCVAIAFIIVFFNGQLKRINLRTEDQIQQMNASAQQQFKILAAESLEKNAASQRSANADQLSALLSPLRIRLEDLNKNLQDNSSISEASRKSLSDQIERLTRLNLSIGEEARNLTSALRGNNRVQGQWGESLLVTILERAGMSEGKHFQTQVTRDDSGETLRNEDGKFIRPDLLLKLPANRFIVIDSKASLSAYLDFCDSTSEDNQAACARRHVMSVKKHVDELAAKKYSRSVPGAVEQVLMFIPNDGALIAALNADPTILEYSLARKITIVSPASLLSVIQIVDELWRRDDQDRNAKEIARIGGLLYDSVAAFLKDFQQIDRSISAAKNAYESALQRLNQGPRSVVARAERLSHLGVPTSRPLPMESVNEEVEEP